MTKTDSNDNTLHITVHPMKGAILHIVAINARGKRRLLNTSLSLTQDECARLAASFIEGAGEDWRKYLS